MTQNPRITIIHLYQIGRPAVKDNLFKDRYACSREQLAFVQTGPLYKDAAGLQLAVRYRLPRHLTFKIDATLNQGLS